MKCFRLFALIGLLGIGISGYGQNCNPSRDSLVLADFFSAMGGNSWKIKWNLNQPMRQWHGVTVSQEGCVVGLELKDNNLGKNLSNLDLPFLEILDLSDNEILTSLPDFSKLKNLRELNLSGNQFINRLPALKENIHLEILKAKNNDLSGAIPDLNHLVDLRILDLSGNKFSGTIPALNRLTKVEEINFSGNDLAGEIGFIEGYKNIVRIDFHNNRLSGAIPDLKDLSHLDYINLSENYLSGDMPRLQNLTELRLVDFSRNQLNGRFFWPEEVPELRELRLSHNQIVDTLQDISNLGQLEKLHLTNNRLGGEIPQMDLPLLSELFLDGNQLTGDIPDFLSLPRLKQFSLKGNFLENVRFQFSFLDRIVFGNISDNKLTFKDIADFASYEESTIILMPQKNISFFMPGMKVTKGNNFSIKLDTDENHGFTEYHWYVNDKKSGFNYKTEYNLSNVIPADEGEYRVELTNRKMPGAVIHSDIFYLEVECPMVVEQRQVYLCPGQTFTYKGQEFSRDTIFVDSVAAQTDRVCDSLYIFRVSNYAPDTVHTESVLCHDEIYYFGPDSIELTASGYYIDTFPNLGGCDSIVHLDLMILPKYEEELTVGRCPGDSLIYGDSIYFSDVDLIDSLTSADGCDSIVIRSVRFSDPVRTHTVHSVCEGDSVMIGEVYFKSDALWADTLQARAGCDSIAVTEVRVNQKYEETLTVSLCAPETYLWQGRRLSQSGFYSDTLQSAAGCDSILSLNLTIWPSYDMHDTVYICPGDSVFFNNMYVKDPGSYFSDKTTAEGCDSMNVLHVFHKDYIEIVRYEQLCAGDTIRVGNKAYLAPGVYSETVPSASGEGCDTLYIYELDGIELSLNDSVVTGSTGSGSTGSIFAEMTGGIEPYQYVWDTGDTTSFLDSIAVGEYVLLVTDSLGCTAEFTFEVPLLTSSSPGPVQKNWVALRPNQLKQSSGTALVLDFYQPMRSGLMNIYNEMGQRVYYHPLERIDAGQSVSVRLRGLPAGVYVVHILEGNGTAFQVEKLVVF